MLRHKSLQLTVFDVAINLPPCNQLIASRLCAHPRQDQGRVLLEMSELSGVRPELQNLCSIAKARRDPLKALQG
jgi:hypothetical protein